METITAYLNGIVPHLQITLESTTDDNEKTFITNLLKEIDRKSVV